MSNRNHRPNTKPCKCNKCGTEAVSVPGTPHRRCPGQEGQPIRQKHQRLPESRGRWE